MNTITTISWIVVISMITILAIYGAFQYRKMLVERIQFLDRIPSQVYDSKFGKIEYLLRGKGPTILVSHGITGGIDQGMGMIEDLIRPEYQFLYISRFGYLKSSIPENPTAGLQGDAYCELLNHLGIETAFVLGNSAGGTSAIQFAIRHPEKCKGLILISSNAPLDAKQGNPPMFIFKSDFLYWLFLKLVGGTMMSMFLPKSIVSTLSDKEKREIAGSVFFSALPVSKRTQGIAFDLTISNPSINTDISFDDISAPTLIINAVDDPATRIEGAERLAGRIRNSTLVIVTDGGHLLLNQEEIIRKHIDEFVSQSSEQGN